jgi:methyltransferase
MQIISTQGLFLMLIVAVIIQRIIELKINKRNLAIAMARGGKKPDDNLLNAVKVLQVSWGFGMIAEVWLLNRPFVLPLAIICFLIALMAQFLRYLSMQALGWRWTLPIVVVPHLPAVNTGIYRYLRHPNWLGVMAEIWAIPLIHGAYITSTLFSLINAWIIGRRVRQEEKALSQATNYASVFAHTPRFVPQFCKSIANKSSE